MKRFALSLLLVALTAGAAWAGTRLDLDAGALSGTLDSLNAFEVEGQAGGEVSSIFLGETAAEQTPQLAALLVASHGSAATLETVTFDASGSLPGNGIITLYEWDLDGDSTFDTSSELGTLEHIYLEDGIVFVQVRVTNNLDESAVSEVLQLEIVNRLPTARFAVNLGAGEEGDLVQFLNLSTDLDGTIISWLWDLGDGTTSNEASPSHIFDAAGLFNVTLSVADNDGGTSDTYELEVKIGNLEPLAGFTLQQSALNVSQQLFIIDESIDPSVNGEIVHVAWDFGDGTYQAGSPSSDDVYSHVFALPGIYTITLYVIDNGGAMARAESTIEVL